MHSRAPKPGALVVNGDPLRPPVHGVGNGQVDMRVRGQGLRGAVMALSFAALLACLALLFYRVQHIEDDVAQSVTSAMWSLAQAETEYLRFLRGLEVYDSGDAGLSHEDLTSRFENLRSSLPALIEGPDLQTLRSKLDLDLVVPPMLATMEQIEPLVYALEPGDQTSFATIVDAMSTHAEPLHGLVKNARWIDNWQEVYRADLNSIGHQEILWLFIGAVLAGAILIGLLINEFQVTRRLLLQSEATEQQLLQARNTAEQANVAKSRFLAAANHDLRQPMQSLTMLLALLQRTNDWHHRQVIYGQISDKLEAMGRLLNVLLDINNLEEGRIEVNRSDLPLSNVFDRLESESRLAAQKAGIRIRFVPSRLLVQSDPVLLEQVLANLISNAIRYTQEGKILVGCRRQGSTARIEVWDTGPGISEDQLDKIFHDYYQLENPSRDPNKGLGLGLAIVLRLADMLDHKVTARSEVGKGSTFTVEVPITGRVHQTRTKVRPQTDARDLSRRTVLMVEDNETMLETTARLLEIWGAKVIQADSGAAALKALHRDGPRPDLIIADYRLKTGPNGLEATQKIREIYGQDIPAILMTGDTAAEVTREIEAANCALAHKPFRPNELQNLMITMIAQGDQDRAKAAAAETAPTSRLRAAAGE